MSRRAAPRSIATWVSWPQACIAPAFSDANSRPVSSVSGRPSMSARSRIVGPGRAPSMTATTESVVAPGRPLEPDRPQRLDHDRLRPGQPEADLGAPVEPAAHLDDVGERGAGGRQERMDRGGFGGHEGSLLATRTPPDCRTPTGCRAPADGTMPRLVGPSSVEREGGRCERGARRWRRRVPVIGCRGRRAGGERGGHRRAAGAPVRPRRGGGRDRRVSVLAWLTVYTEVTSCCGRTTSSPPTRGCSRSSACRSRSWSACW